MIHVLTKYYDLRICYLDILFHLMSPYWTAVICMGNTADMYCIVSMIRFCWQTTSYDISISWFNWNWAYCLVNQVRFKHSSLSDLRSFVYLASGTRLPYISILSSRISVKSNNTFVQEAISLSSTQIDFYIVNALEYSELIRPRPERFCSFHHGCHARV